MDGRKYDAVHHVAPGVFTTEQRQRLEAFTAAVGLLGEGRTVDELVDAARYITDNG